MPFAQDNFNRADGPLLNSTASGGGTWTQVETFSTSWTIGDNNARQGVAANGWLKLEVAPESAEYDIEAEITFLSFNTANHWIGVAGRISEGNAYVARYNYNYKRWEVNEVIDGSITETVHFVESPSEGTGTLRFEIRNSAKILYWNDVEKCRMETNNLTDAGYPGLFGRGSFGQYQATLDNFVATNVEGGGGDPGDPDPGDPDPGDALIFDDFNRPSETLIGSTASGGGVWEQVSNWDGGFAITNQKIRSGTAYGWAAHSTVLSTDEYDVEVDMEFITSAVADFRLGVFGRLDPVNEDLYLARYNANARRWELTEWQGGVVTDTVVFNEIPGDSAVGKLRLEIRDSAKILFWNDVEKCRLETNNVTGAGQAGVYGRRGLTGDGLGYLDNFAVRAIGEPSSEVTGSGAAQCAPATASGVGDSGGDDPVPTPSVFAEDDFNRANGSLLDSNASDGGTWQATSYGTSLWIDGNRVRASTGENALVHSAVAPEEEFDVEAIVDVTGIEGAPAERYFGLVALDPQTTTGYMFRWHGFYNQWQLYRREGGTSTLLDAAGDVPPPQGSTGTIRLEIRDGRVAGFWNDVEQVSAQENITPAGAQPGIYGRNAFSTPHLAYFDHFTASSITYGPGTNTGSGAAQSQAASASGTGAVDNPLVDSVGTGAAKSGPATASGTGVSVGAGVVITEVTKDPGNYPLAWTSLLKRTETTFVIWGGNSHGPGGNNSVRQYDAVTDTWEIVSPSDGGDGTGLNNRDNQCMWYVPWRDEMIIAPSANTGQAYGGVFHFDSNTWSQYWTQEDMEAYLKGSASIRLPHNPALAWSDTHNVGLAAHGSITGTYTPRIFLVRENTEGPQPMRLDYVTTPIAARGNFRAAGFVRGDYFYFGGGQLSSGDTAEFWRFYIPDLLVGVATGERLADLPQGGRYPALVYDTDHDQVIQYGGGVTNMLATYDFSTDTWAVHTTDELDRITLHTAVYSHGRGMYVTGGNRYDPVTGVGRNWTDNNRMHRIWIGPSATPVGSSGEGDAQAGAAQASGEGTVVNPAGEFQITVHPLPSGWNSPSPTGSKHMRMTIDGDGTVWEMGGDYSGSPGPQSGRGENWSLHYDAGTEEWVWSKVVPYCGEGQTQMPARCDEVGYTYDALRNQLWFTGGFGYDDFGPCDPPHPDVISVYGDFGVFDLETYLWDFAPNQPWGDLSGTTTENGRPHHAVHDPVKDVILRFLFHGGYGSGLAIYNCKTGEQTTMQLKDQFGWTNGRFHKEYIAADIAGRKVYMLEPYTSRLFELDLDTYAWTRLEELAVPSPGSPVIGQQMYFWCTDRLIICSQNDMSDPIDLYEWKPDTGLRQLALPPVDEAWAGFRANCGVWHPEHGLLLFGGLIDGNTDEKLRRWFQVTGFDTATPITTHTGSGAAQSREATATGAGTLSGGVPAPVEGSGVAVSLRATAAGTGTVENPVVDNPPVYGTGNAASQRAEAWGFGTAAGGAPERGSGRPPAIWYVRLK